MNLKTLSVAILATSMTLFSCQQEESDIPNQQINLDKFQSEWLNADLNQVLSGKEMNFYISDNQLQNVVQPKEAYQVRFIPGFINGDLHFKVVSIDQFGTILSEETVAQQTELKLGVQVNKLRDQQLLERNIPSTVKKHIMTYALADQFITAFHNKAKPNINEITSYNGDRIRHFAYTPEVVKDMIANPAEGFSLSLGVNQEDKLTTVFIPLQGNEVINTKEGGSAYDFTQPCPNTCDPPTNSDPE